MQAPNYPYPDQISIVDHLGMFLAQWIFFLGMFLAQLKFFLGMFLLRWQLEVILRGVLHAVEVPLRDPPHRACGCEWRLFFLGMFLALWKL